MPKLETINGGLANLKKQLGRTPENLDGIKADIRALTSALQVMMSALSNRDKNDDFTQSSIKQLAKAVNALGKQVQSRPDLTGILDDLRDDIKTLPRDIPTPKEVVIPDHNRALTALEASIKGMVFPEGKETDLTALVDLSTQILEAQNKPVVIPTEKRKTKWTFTIERDSEDLLQRVIVT